MQELSLKTRETQKTDLPNDLQHDGHFYYLKLPKQQDIKLDQDREWVIVGLKTTDGVPFEKKIRFHDYDEIYKIKGLYEYIFSKTLKCRSPEIVARILRELTQLGSFDNILPYKILDIGAGGGLVTEALMQNIPCEASLGVDILPEARLSAQRDRPCLYQDYLVADLTALTDREAELITDFKPNCLTCISALGYDDIPVEAFVTAYNAIETGGAIAFTVRDKFLGEKDSSGFSKLVNNLMDSGKLEVLMRKKFFHRLSIDGRVLNYIAIFGKKKRNI